MLSAINVREKREITAAGRRENIIWSPHARKVAQQGEREGKKRLVMRKRKKKRNGSENHGLLPRNLKKSNQV